MSTQGRGAATAGHAETVRGDGAASGERWNVGSGERTAGSPATTTGRRGVSTVLGVTLLLAIVVAGTAIVVTLGGTAFANTQDTLDADRAEKALTQFDSRSAMVALGGTGRQGVDLAVDTTGSYAVENDAGWMNVSVTNANGNDKTVGVVNVTLGEVAYQGQEARIAYQGGGVWKSTEGRSVMVSPPEFHFRAATLTLPLISVDGDPSLGSQATVEKAGPASIRYPNASQNAAFVNPLENGRVNVTVHSDYYRAWGQYFEQRTSGTVYYDHANGTARVELVVPFDGTYENAIATTQPGGITVRGNDPKPTPHATGVNYPLPDSRIEDRIQHCKNASNPCDTSTSPSNINSPGTYFIDSSFTGDLDVDTSNGNVTVVVNGDFEPNSVSNTGGNHTTVMVRNDLDTNSDINPGGVPGMLGFAVHSDGKVEVRGNTDVDAFVYAPGSTCNLRGSGVITGGVVCETAQLRGNPTNYVYDSSIKNTDLNLTGQATKITFLHVTVNRVNVTD